MVYRLYFWFMSCILIILLGACVTASDLPVPLTTVNTPPKSDTLPTIVDLPTVTPNPQPSPSLLKMSTHLLLTNSSAYHITRLDPANGQYEQLEVGAAPWGIVLNPERTLAYVATAEGVAVVDLDAWQRTALIPYASPVGTAQFGEYRPGGMGIAVAPDGREVYVGVYLGSAASQLEILDTARQRISESYAVGLRPFQVLASADGQRVFSIDHDSFTVTVLDLATRTTQSLSATPLGSTSLSSFDKPHYAVIDSRGHLLLPYQGTVLLDLDAMSGTSITLPLTANTHQHGIAWTPDGSKLLIVGTGAAGSASGGASLTLLDWASGGEEIVPLMRPHEHVAVSPDGHLAYLTGGYSFANGGWDGVTVLDLVDYTTREIAVPDRPLDIVVLP